MTKPRTITTLMVVGLLLGCATPTVVETKKTGDANLSCAQLKTELEEAEKYFKAAKKERTVTGTNVAAAVFFLPGLLGTYVNTEEAMTAAKEREAVLKKIAEKKKCDLDNTEAAAPIQTTPVVQKTSPAVQSVALQSPTPSQTIPSKVEMVDRPLTLKEVQEQLVVLGYSVGAADGSMGKRTSDALRKFQQDKGILITGKVDSATIEKLRLTGGNMATK